MSACETPAVVERLERHAGAHRAVADDGDALADLALHPRRHRHAERRRDRGRRVGGAEGVRTRSSSRRGKPEMPPSWRSVDMRSLRPVTVLVRVRLVADVPDQRSCGVSKT
jgi:hypothetical protein